MYGLEQLTNKDVHAWEKYHKFCARYYRITYHNEVLAKTAEKLSQECRKLLAARGVR